MVQLNFEKQGGLIPVIVTDYQTGQVLMLAYMNQDAYEKTLSTGKCTTGVVLARSFGIKAQRVDIFKR